MTLHTLGLSELVNFTTNEPHEQLLGESVFHRFSYSSLSFVRVEYVADGCLPSLRWWSS